MELGINPISAARRLASEPQFGKTEWTPADKTDFHRRQLLLSTSKLPLGEDRPGSAPSPSKYRMLSSDVSTPYIAFAGEKPSEADEHPEGLFQRNSYLAPLVPMVRAKDAEIRRQAICALATLTDERHRSAVASLKDTHGRSLLRDLLQYAHHSHSAAMRHEAVNGLANLLKSRSTHGYMLQAGLLPDLLQLVRLCAPGSMRPAAYTVACLCSNENVAPEMLRAGFVPQLLWMQAKTVDFIVRRHAAHALASLSLVADNKVPMQREGALDAAVELLRAKDRELRRHGGALGCNLCLHSEVKRHVVRSGLLAQLLSCAQPPTPGEDEDPSLSLASLCTDGSLHEQLCERGVAAALLSLLRHGSREAKANAAWAVASIVPYARARRDLLRGGLLPLLLACIAERDKEGLAAAHTRQARRDAMRALSWLAAEPGVGPSSADGATLRVVSDGGMSRDVEMQEAALLALATWCENLATQEAVVRGGGLPALVYALRLPTAASRLYASRAVACLSVDARYRAPLAAEGAVPPLLKLLASLRTIEWSVVQQVARTLCNLSKDQAIAMSLLRHGSQPSLLSAARIADTLQEQRRANPHATPTQRQRTLRRSFDSFALLAEGDELTVAGKLAQWRPDRGVQVSSYAMAVLANLQQAWQLEAEHAADAAKASAGYLDGAALQRVGSVRARTFDPHRTVKEAVFGAWRHLREINQTELLRQGSRSTGKRRGGLPLQEDVRDAAQAATRLQAAQRGKLARRHSASRRNAAGSALAASALAAASPAAAGGGGGGGSSRPSSRPMTPRPRSVTAVSADEALRRLGAMLQDEKKRVTDLFFAMDHNADGMISHSEFREGLLKLDLRVEGLEERAFFGKLDPDDSGFVDFKLFNRELRQGMKERLDGSMNSQMLGRKRATER